MPNMVINGSLVLGDEDSSNLVIDQARVIFNTMDVDSDTSKEWGSSTEDGREEVRSLEGNSE
jgi:hypothetical protein